LFPSLFTIGLSVVSSLMAPKKLPPHLSEKKFANEDLEEPESPLLCGYDSHEGRPRGCLGRLSRRTCYTLGALGMVLAIAVSVVAGYLIGTKVFSANLKVAEGTVVKYGLPSKLCSDVLP